jgi:Tol biopolymer transport system component
LLTDPRGVMSPRFSPDGTRVVYATERPASLMVHSIADSRSRALDVGDVRMSGIVGLGWRGNDSVWIEVHDSPIASSYVEVDATTGRVEKQMQRRRVSVSPDGRHLVSIEAAPKTNPRARASALLFDDEIVHPGKEDPASHDIGAVTWAPNSRELAFVEAVGDENRVLILSTHDKTARELPIDVIASDLQWLPDGSLLVSGDGRHLLVDPASGRSRSLQDAEARQWLFVMTPRRSHRIEDRYCRR